MVEFSGMVVPDALRDKVASAILEAQRTQEIGKLLSVPFDPAEYDQAIDRMIAAGTEITIISGWAVLSKLIDTAVKFHVCNGSKRDVNEFFSGFGPLSTDAGKVKLARLIGWLPSRTFEQLTIIRKIRNRCAHEVLSEPDILELARVPRDRFKDLSAIIVAANNAFNEEINTQDDGHELLSKIDDLGFLKLAVVILANSTFQSIICGPGNIVLGYSADNGGLFYNLENGPEWAKEMHRSTARAMIKIMGKYREVPDDPDPIMV